MPSGKVLIQKRILFISLVFGGGIFSALFRTDYLSFSTYPMFSEPISIERLTAYRFSFASESGKELHLPRFCKRFDTYLLRVALNTNDQKLLEKLAVAGFHNQISFSREIGTLFLRAAFLKDANDTDLPHSETTLASLRLPLVEVEED